MKKSLLLSVFFTFNIANLSYAIDDLDEKNHEHRTGFKPAAKHLTQAVQTHFDKQETVKIFDAKPKKFSLPTGSHVELKGVSYYPKELINQQGPLGSCTANALNACLKHETIRMSSNPEKLLDNPDMLSLSRLFQYYVTRDLEGRFYQEDYRDTDTGASIVGAIAALDIYGGTPEKLSYSGIKVNSPDLKGLIQYQGWGYNPSKFAETPPAEAWRLAQDSNLLGINIETSLNLDKKTLLNPYAKIATDIRYKDLSSEFRELGKGVTNSQESQDKFLGYIQSALSKNHAIFAGISGDDNTFNDHNGYFPSPNFKTFRPTNGHAFKVVGLGYYNPSNKNKLYVKMENSWGSDWGQNGFGYFEASHLSQLNMTNGEFFEVWLDKATAK